MSFTIKRSWGVNYKSLLARPRISHKVSEYVFDFINENLLKSTKVLQSDKYIYDFTLSFSPSIPKNRKFPFPYTSPYATETRLFFGQKGFRTFADFQLSNYKKFDKEDFDKLILQLHKNHIESFTFPASFEDQQYSLDDIEQPVIPLCEGYEWVDIDKWTKINPKIEYLNHYEF